MKNIQLFTRLPEKYENNCEVNAQLMSYKIMDGYIYLKTKEDNYVFEHVFPLWNVSMVRISHHD